VSRFRASTASAALAAALVGVALGARGGTELERTAVTELLLLGGGAAVVCAAVALGPRGRVHGKWAVTAFVALTVVTALSIDWSIAPDVSYLEASRTLAYLAVFAGAVAAARLAPDAAPAVLRGILLAAIAISAYGLAARVWPASFDESALIGRIGLPFDYWNALAGVAAAGVVPALWLGTRRAGSMLGRALAYPATGLLIATVLIASSRGALAGAAVAVAVWLAVVPLRLRSVAVLTVGAAGAAPVAAWALSKDPFSASLQPLAAREAVAGDFGLLLAAMLIALLAAGSVVEAVRARHRPSVALRVRSGVAIAVVAVVVPLALLTSVATSDRGLGGSVSDRVDDLTSETAVPPVGGARLGSVSSARATYWRQAWHAFEEQPVAGLGAGSFELSRLTYRKSAVRAGHAHGFVSQTLADLGLVGLATALALLAAWIAAAARATSLGPRRGIPSATWTTERTALLALALVAVVFGIQSATDWTWFVPGITVMALVAAGFVAGRGPLPRLGSEPATPSPRNLGWTPLRLGAAGSIAIVALLCGWMIWQPVAADRAVAHSYELLDAHRPAAALREADLARDRNPYSNEPLYASAAALADLGRAPAALRTLRRAVLERPRDPDAWIRIATFQLDTLGSPERALEMVAQAQRVDPHSPVATTVAERANAAIAARDAPPVEAVATP
jgi:tetratricopeptide (TPR) repeat protein